MSVVDSELVKFSSIGAKDWCFVQQNAKKKVCQRMIEKEKGKKRRKQEQRCIQRQYTYCGEG
jgi:hypothetical protein